MLKNKQNEQMYLQRLEQWRHDSLLQWQVVGVFLIPHTIFLGIAVSSLEPGAFSQWDLATVLVAVMGFVLCIPWWSTFSRMGRWWEERQRLASDQEDEVWQVATLEIKQKDHRWDARMNKRFATRFVIIVFAIAYFVLIFAGTPIFKCALGVA